MLKSKSRGKKVIPTLSYTLSDTNPNTTYTGDFLNMCRKERWFKATGYVFIDDVTNNNEKTKVIIKHRTPYKTDLIEYGRQLQTVINSIIKDGFYYPEESVVKVTIIEKPEQGKRKK